MRSTTIMKCEILTKDRWHRMLKKELTRDEFVELRRHFNTDCDACDAFFADMDERTEKILWSIFNEFENSDNSIASRQDDVDTDDFNYELATAYQNDPKWQHWLGDSILARPFNSVYAHRIAAVAVIAITLGLVSQNEIRNFFGPLQTEKGISRTESDINIRFALGNRDQDGKLTVNPGIPGNDYSGSSMLYLSYKIPVSGYIYIIGYKDGNPSELLFPEHYIQFGPLSAGEYSVTRDNQVAGFPLHGLTGRYNIIGIHSPEPLDINERVLPIIQQSVGSLKGSIKHELVDAINQKISVDVVYFNVYS